MIKTKLKDIAVSQTGPFGSLLHESDYVEHGTPIGTVEHLGETGFSHQNLQYFNAKKVALIYPCDFQTISGKFADIDHPNSESNFEWSLIFIPFGSDVKLWQFEIANRVKGWVSERIILTILESSG